MSFPLSILSQAALPRRRPGVDAEVRYVTPDTRCARRPRSLRRRADCRTSFPPSQVVRKPKRCTSPLLLCRRAAAAAARPCGRQRSSSKQQQRGMCMYVVLSDAAEGSVSCSKPAARCVSGLCEIVGAGVSPAAASGVHAAPGASPKSPGPEKLVLLRMRRGALSAFLFPAPLALCASLSLSPAVFLLPAGKSSPSPALWSAAAGPRCCHRAGACARALSMPCSFDCPHSSSFRRQETLAVPLLSRD